jgi:hypothetical protein
MADDDEYAVVGTPRFALGRVVSDTFETLIRTGPRLLAIVGILGVPVVVWLILGGRNQLLQFAAAVSVEGSRSPYDPAAYVLAALLFLVGLGIHAAVTDAAFEDMLGEPGDLLQSLGRALVVAPVLIAVAVFVAALFGISVFAIGFAGALVARVIHWSFGLMLALGGVAGVIALMVHWWVLVPVIVVEGANPIECFKRSMELTDGNRWKICALVLMIYAPQVGATILLLIAGPAFGEVAVAVVNILLSALFMTFNAVATVMIYGHLRAIKEGFTTDALADVFD